MSAFSVVPGGPSLVVESCGGFVSSLKPASGPTDTEYVEPGGRLGDLVVRYRQGGGAWQTLETAHSVASSFEDDRAFGASSEVPGVLSVRNRFERHGGSLVWTIELKNPSTAPVEVGDLAIPLPISRECGPEGRTFILKHSFVSGNGSFLFWLRSDNAPAVLVMTPLERTGLEYWEAGPDGYRVYVHSVVDGAAAKERGTNWRQPHTDLVLAPGAGKSYGFKFQLVRSQDEVRQLLFDEGLVDVMVVPGMTVPSDLFAEVALRCKQPIASVEAEYPKETRVQRRSSSSHTTIFRVRFSRLGENRLTVRYGDGQSMVLEFFCTEPLETLIKKRGAFLARSQHRDPSKWYDGLITDWNMESQTLISPDNRDRLHGFRIYAVTCDDPGLGKPAFLAAKNAEYPVQKEVEALDYYIAHFVWGGLQRTDAETDPFGVYGIQEWYANRHSEDPGRGGQRHLWRIYDYPHIVLMYFGMYRVAKDHPEVKTALPAAEYLRRAYGTANALFTLPMAIENWSADQTGLYNELVIVDLIDALDQEGLHAEASALRAHWERKVRAFVDQEQNLFQSEYAFDSTGFESTQALADYAMARPGAFDPAKARAFMKAQMEANLFCRGCIEPAYYYLGSDYRGCAGDAYTLSYMAQMGGWSVLDYGLHVAPDPAPYLRLGYASILSSWALMNTGTPKSNYGYWYPGAANDGGAGGGFEPAPFGETWLEQPHHRGSWYYACEIDLGFSGALRAAATVLADDPVFGRFCYGGTWRQSEGRLEVFPKDGVRRRFCAVLGARKLQIVSDVDRFAVSEPIALRDDLSQVSFALETANPSAHAAVVRVSGLPAGRVEVVCERKVVATVEAVAGQACRLSLPMPAGLATRRFTVLASKGG